MTHEQLVALLAQVEDTFVERKTTHQRDVTRDGRRILAILPSVNDFQLEVSLNWITSYAGGSPRTAAGSSSELAA
jgi:hypothetical protein